MKLNAIMQTAFCALLALCTVVGCDDSAGRQGQSSGNRNSSSSPNSSQSVNGDDGAQTATSPPHESWIDTTKLDATELDAIKTRKNILVVYDGSGSMNDKASGERKYIAAQRAMQTFTAAIPEDVNLGLVVFNGRIEEKVPLGAGAENRRQFMSVVDGVRPNGGTPLSSSIRLAYDKLREQGLKQLGYGEYWLVVVTDGDADWGENPRDIVQKILDESPVMLYTVGFNIGQNHSLNQSGRTIYKEARNRQEIETALRAVTVEEEEFVPLDSFTAP